MSIELTDVRAGYIDGVPVLNGIDLTVRDGAIVTVLGPNGSGKSTLLKAIMGLLPLSGGSVAVDGERVDSAPVHERAVRHGVAYVPQLDNVFGAMTIRENLEIGGARLPRRERRERANELLEHYPTLAARPRARADSLSGGERQMLALARALMTRPRYLLLDEPSAGLSPRMLGEMFAAIVAVRETSGATLLIVEQNAVQSLAVSDEGCVLVLGEVALKGAASQIADDPRIRELYLGGPLRPSAGRSPVNP
ncbi:MAG: branched-chain amino acid transport system ATP-binding protein [Solirubrobacteraceae bacterium]